MFSIPLPLHPLLLGRGWCERGRRAGRHLEFSAGSAPHPLPVSSGLPRDRGTDYKRVSVTIFFRGGYRGAVLLTFEKCFSWRARGDYQFGPRG